MQCMFTSQNPRGVGFGSRLYDGSWSLYGGRRLWRDEDYGCFKSAENCLMVYIKDKNIQIYISLAIGEEGEIKNVHLTQVQPSRNKHYYFINEPSKSQLRSGKKNFYLLKWVILEKTRELLKKKKVILFLLVR